MINAKNIAIIGDIHGQFNIYNKIIDNYDASIQVGDFGFEDTWTKLLTNNINSLNHKIIPGNHDDYNYINNNNPTHNLGDYGLINFHEFKFWFLRGEYSIDLMYRIENRDWWKAEELEYDKLYEAIKNYEIELPDVVIAHTLPGDLINVLFRNMLPIRSNTQNALQQMFEIHKPKLWIFGHFHPTNIIVKNILGCTFIALPEFGVINYRTDLSLDENISDIKKYNK